LKVATGGKKGKGGNRDERTGPFGTRMGKEEVVGPEKEKKRGGLCFHGSLLKKEMGSRKRLLRKEKRA